MLEIVRTYLGYCFSCRLPKFVADLKITGWHHVIPMCDGCLAGVVKDIRDAMPQTPGRYLEVGRLEPPPTGAPSGTVSRG